MTPDVARAAVPLAEVVRGGLVESVHLGHLVVDPAAGDRLVLGDPAVVIWPRSSVKPLQAVAMVRSGLDLPPRLLALAAASHNGEAEHLAGAREILASVGLDEAALRNTPDMPVYAPAAFEWQSTGHGPAPITQNCSGKHAAMLATCVVAGWDTAAYLDAEHPLQQVIRSTLLELTGDESTRVTTDGCGAPLFATSLAGLARSFGRIASAPVEAPTSPEAQVARALSAFPEMVGGTGRDATDAMRAVPGLVAKDGADGVYAAGLPDGGSLAFKVLDGSARPRPAVLVAALRHLGAERLGGTDARALAAVGQTPVLGGGVPVGEVRATFSGASAEAAR
ncbi:asparaginase [Oerskovia flava]|uniref:asparaginase n=1 Tax=Oerskovia flava TaxID=2986422 RepID=UPI002AD500AB|nr:asparaginase [Oerskovia sp. JB1-3-2]